MASNAYNMNHAVFSALLLNTDGFFQNVIVLYNNIQADLVIVVVIFFI